MQSKLMNESVAVSKISSAIEGKNFNEVEQLLNLFTVLKSERDIMSRFDSETPSQVDDKSS